MTRDETTLSEVENKTKEQDKIPATKELFIKITNIEPLPDNEDNQQIINTFSGKADEILRSLEAKGLVSGTEAENINEVWRNALVLDDEGFDWMSDYQTSFLRNVIRELRKLDPEGENPECQRLIKNAVITVDDIEDKNEGALALIFKPNPLQLKEVGIEHSPGPFIIINKDKINSTNETQVAALVYEESAHLLSKLSSYGINNTWLEEVMAKEVAYSVHVTDQSSDSVSRQEFSDLIRFKDYDYIFDVLKEETGDGGDTLIRMFYGRESQNSPLVAKVKEAAGKFDYIAQVIDSGVPVENLLNAIKQDNSNKNASEGIT